MNSLIKVEVEEKECILCALNLTFLWMNPFCFAYDQKYKPISEALLIDDKTDNKQ